MTKDRRVVIAILAVVVLAGVLRFSALSSVPSGFFRDEADKGYSAYSLLETGADVQGRPWPLFISSLAVYTTALYQYACIPAIAAFGLNEFAVRFPAALIGTLSVVAIYLLGRRWFGVWTGVIAALLLAVSPWHLVFSRWANQGIMMPFFITMGLYLRERAKDRAWWLVPSGLSFCLALYAYEPAKAVLPLLLFGLLMDSSVRRERKLIRFDLFNIAAVAALAVPMVLFHLNNPGMSDARYSRISVLGAAEGNVIQALLLFIKNYLAHLSPAFLFFSGDENLRHSASSVGQLYLLDAALILCALYALWKDRKSPIRLALLWAAVSIVPAALTNEGIPHALRTIGGIPAFVLLSAAGAKEIWLMAKDSRYGRCFRVAGYALAATGLILVYLFLQDYFIAYPAYSATSWEYGWRQAIEAAEERKGEFPHIIVSGLTSYPEIFFQFYTKHPPAKGGEALPDKYLLLPFGQPADLFLMKIPRPALCIVRAGELNQIQPLETIRYPDETVAWKIVAIR